MPTSKNDDRTYKVSLLMVKIVKENTNQLSRKKARNPERNSNLNRHPVADWVHQQVYLRPYARELRLQLHNQI
jgi:hypothetical protein